jgi:hypothetical protein
LRSTPRLVRAIVLVIFGAGLGLLVFALTSGDDAATGVRIAKRGPVHFVEPKPQGPARTEGVDAQLQAGVTAHEVKNAKLGKNFRADAAGVKKLFNLTLGKRGRAGLNTNTLISVKCANGACQIRYIPDGPGAGRVLESQGPLWRGLLTDRAWRSATVVALRGGPDLYAVGGQEAAAKGGPTARSAPLVSVTCTRDDVRKVGIWGIQSSPRIKTYCTFGLDEQPGH